MADETAAALRDVAELLRQRMTLSAEMSRKTAEHLATIPVPLPPIDFAAAEARAAEADRARQEAVERRHGDEQAFRERLLATLERQNELLERLIERSAG